MHCTLGCCLSKHYILRQSELVGSRQTKIQTRTWIYVCTHTCRLPLTHPQHTHMCIMACPHFVILSCNRLLCPCVSDLFPPPQFPQLWASCFCGHLLNTSFCIFLCIRCAFGEFLCDLFVVECEGCVHTFPWYMQSGLHYFGLLLASVLVKHAI